MERLPDAVFIMDTNKEDIAVTEANKLGIPIVAVVDTNCDPDIIQYVIPGNDDAIRSASLMARVVADAVEEGRFIHSRKSGNGAGPAPTRTDEQEAAVAAQQAEARRQAALAAQEREARLATQATTAEATVIADEQSAVENASLASGENTHPGLTPENALNILDDASAVTQAEIAAEHVETPVESVEAPAAEAATSEEA